MQNVIECIAHHADIDTRRAMGFQPRKLPPSDLNFPLASEFNQGRTRRIRLTNAELYVGLSEIAWAFGTDDFMKSRSCYFRRDDGRVSLYALLKMEHSRHPDFNDDRTLRDWRT